MMEGLHVPNYREESLKWKPLASLESQLGQTMFCWGTQVKGSRQVKECSPRGDTGEGMFYHSKQVKGCTMFRRNNNMIPQTVGA